GQQGLGIAQALQLDPARAGVVEIGEELTGEPGVTDGVLGAKAASRVRQDRIALKVEKVENIAAFLVEEAFATDGDGGHVTTAGHEAITHEVIAGVLARARDEPAVKRKLADDERLVRRRFRNGRAAADQRDNLDGIAARQPVLRVARQRYDFLVDFHGNAAAVVAKLL